jgi:FkbM family methyltransferase
VLAYGAELQRLPRGLADSLFSSWRPVFGNEACVVFYRGPAEATPLASSDPSLASLARFYAQLRRLSRDGGLYRAGSGLAFRCRGGADIGAVEEAWSVYMPRLSRLGRLERVLDLGAHVGGFSVPVADKHGASVAAYEPDPDSRALLLENLRLNGAAGVRSRPEAAGGRTGRGRLFVCAANSVRSNLYGPLGDGPDVPVELLPLPEILRREGWRRADLVKIDVEGAEYEILFPLAGALAGMAGAVLVEAHREGGRGESDMAEFLAGQGFEVERCGGGVLFALGRRA